MVNDINEEELRSEVDTFLISNFPQIKMHGGEFTILEADPEDGFVSVQLSGACSGCGISPMTKEAIRSRLPDNVEGVNMVKVETTGSDMTSGRF
jgi:Fe-S cluster biogenesis protein NfuA